MTTSWILTDKPTILFKTKTKYFIIVSSFFLSFFLPLHNTVLILQPILWLCLVLSSRLMSWSGFTIFSCLNFIPVFLTSWDFLPLSSVLLAALCEVPVYLLFLVIPLALDKLCFRYIYSDTLSKYHSYLSPTFFISTWYLFQTISPYGVAASPANMFMRDWNMVWLPMGLGGLALTTYLVLVPVHLAASHLQGRGGTRHLRAWGVGWLVLLTVSQLVSGGVLRDSPLLPERTGYMTLVGVLEADNDDMAPKTLQAAQLGPTMVLQREGCHHIDPSQQAGLMEYYSDMAVEYGVWLGISCQICTEEGQCFHDNATGRSYNLMWIFDTDGEVVLTYAKHHEATGMEWIVEGDGVVPVVDTPLGRLCVVVCNDACFPLTVADCGRAGADLLLSPAWDPSALLGLETPTMGGRALENGLTFLRLVSDGRTIAVDGFGRTLVDYAAPNDDLSHTDGLVWMTLPTGRGFFTLYPFIAGWIEMVFVLLAVGWLIVVLTKGDGNREEVIPLINDAE
eukprot:gnl/Dysnectes_brevis/3618_a4608_679.p1 GENE.gnl/Dysnectes_brevis/3618_a4608_679~~gnl/Dysnectes_brevis/3618_a4608_679.p1  ORF type:complete len:508 (+),score=104.37 gnl/Dysnectes_brevis/3618_a4608_679:58-1581(+)